MENDSDTLKNIYSQSYSSSSAQPNKSGKPSNNNNAKKPKSAKVIIPAIIIILLIIGLYALTYSKSTPNATTNSFVYKQLSHKNLSASNIYEVSKNISSTINSTNEINASYSGSAKITISYGEFSYPITMPLNVSFKKYGNDSILSFELNTSASNSNLLGEFIFGDENLKFSYAKINGSDYYCRVIKDNFNVNQSFVGKEICTKVNASPNNSTNLPIINSTLKRLDNEIQFYNSSVKIAECNNMQGYLFNSNFKLKNFSNGTIGESLKGSQVSGSLSTCFIPSKSDLPAFVNLNATMADNIGSSSLLSVQNLSISMLLNLNETELSNTLPKSEATTLPGKLVNASELKSTGALPIYSTNISSSNSNLNSSFNVGGLYGNNGKNSTTKDNITFVTSAISNKSYISDYLSGPVQITYASGDSGFVHVTITGSNGKVYFSNGTNNWCMNDPAIDNVTLPPMQYNITIGVGRGGGACGDAEVIISSH